MCCRCKPASLTRRRRQHITLTLRRLLCRSCSRSEREKTRRNVAHLDGRRRRSEKDVGRGPTHLCGGACHWNNSGAHWYDFVGPHSLFTLRVSSCGIVVLFIAKLVTLEEQLKREAGTRSIDEIKIDLGRARQRFMTSKKMLLEIRQWYVRAFV